jgi:UDP-4-amino-4-deoxy-L-arabinose-oxoglutarate aminotransferase
LNLAKGKAAHDFELALISYLGVLGGVLTNTGSQAQMAILLALGVKKGDEVILPTYVCRSVFDAVIAVEATPILCDISTNWLMSYESIVPCVTEKTKAIILVHIFGFDAWDDKIAELGIPIVEDFCQAFGLISKRKNRREGIASFYSFHATKCLTTGEGGFAATRDESVLFELRKLVQKGILKTRFSDLQASLGLSQLKQYSSFMRRREFIANRYLTKIENKYISSDLERNIASSVYFRFPLSMEGIVIPNFVTYMRLNNISVRKGVDTLLHHEVKNYLNGKLYCSETVFEKTICLPIYPSLTDIEVEKVIEKVNGFNLTAKR